MKGIDIFCSSEVVTPISLNMDEPSSSSSSPSSSSIQLEGPGIGTGGRAIDRYNPIIRDPRRISQSSLTTPTPTRTPIPTPKHQNKNRKNISKVKNDQKRKNFVEQSNTIITRKGLSCTKASPGEVISPPGSTRYLLSDEGFLDIPSEIDPVFNLVQFEANKSIPVQIDEPCLDNYNSSHSPYQHQVVVLRVSLHCKGCERKMKKHISRMEGVSSFNIDFAAKKVTVVGDVTPLQVLTSISKVKNAKLWTPPVLSSSTPPVDIQIKKYQHVGGHA